MSAAAPTPALVAVPGLGLSAAVPRHTLDRLACTSTVVELPGFGRPAPRGTALAPDRLAGLLLTRLDEQGVDAGVAPGTARAGADVVLLGHSASCQIVAEAAAAAPGRVRGVVLVGPTTDPRGRGWPTIAARWLRTAAHERPGQVPQLVRDYARTGPATMLRGMEAARRHRIDRALAAVRCPVLAVRGRYDRIAPRDWTEALAAVAPCGRAQTLPAGGHMVPITHPAALAAAVDAFLALPNVSI